MKFINKYLRNFTPYKIASHKVWTVEPEDRNKILKLDWNEATIGPSPLVNEALQNLVSCPNFFNLYPSLYNNELMDLLSSYTNMPSENIQYFASSDSLHEYIAKLYITVGDPVLILGPSYDNFRLTADVCGADTRFFMMDDDFRFDEDEFIKCIKDIDPSVVYICNPNNPTGNIFQPDYIKKLLDKFPQTLFLIDEAYSEFTGVSVKDLVFDYENILISRTMSKAFALANFRFGYLIASQNNIRYISSIRNPKNITTFAQVAACAALSDVSYMRKYVDEVKIAKEYLKTELLSNCSSFKTYGEGGNFLLLRFNKKGAKNSLIDYLFDNNVYVRDLSQTEYLKNYCLRITIGTKKQMGKILKLICQWEKSNEDSCF